MTDLNDDSDASKASKRAFIRKVMETYNVPMDLMRYETLTETGSGGGVVDDME